MKLTVKTLKGGKFELECDPSQSVLEVKGLIESSNAELPAANMKLIHSGKVLKDDQTIENCEIKPSDFLVVMVTKPKKTAPSAVATGSVETASATSAPAETPKASSAAETSGADSKTAATETPAAAPSARDAPDAPSRASGLEVSEEVVMNLTGMGFPEDMVLACLRASNGNADIAVEFLTNGIPPGMESGTSSSAQSPGRSASGGTLSGLRNHPQFNDLRRLVQSNPAMLQNVLTQIGQQQPELLAEINANQEAFLQMMNEPINEQVQALRSQSSAGGSSGIGGSLDGIPPGMMDGMANPAQMAQLIQNMSPTELNQMATTMGLSPDQLRTTAQMLQQIPPEQLNEYMVQAMQGGGGMGGGSGGGGPQVLRLTEEEMAAVNRLVDMGFDRTEAAEAYLACDKNEALAANLLMDGGFGGGDGGGFDFDDNPGNNGDGGSGDDGNDNGDGDDMYD